MLFIVKKLPLVLHVDIGLHVYMALAPFEAILLVDGYKMVEQQGMELTSSYK